MRGSWFIVRSLRFYWRTHLGVLLGATVACALLTGALVVGDSVRASLERMTRSRLGATELALVSGDRFFRAALATDLEQDLPAIVAPLLLVRGAASTPDGNARANEIQVVGVEDRFWRLGGSPDLFEPAGLPGPERPVDPTRASRAGSPEAVVNARLAGQLGLRVGDSLVLRMEEPSVVPRDAPLSGRADASVGVRVRVRAVAGDDAFGRFSLQANQVPPLNVFLPLDSLQEQLGRTGQANVLLVGRLPAEPPTGDALASAARAALAKNWTLADAELEVRAWPAQGVADLRTARVFLDPAVAKAATGIGMDQPSGVLTYFVNEIRLGDRSTPYSFVTAIPGIGPEQIVINSWLAEDLGAKAGDELSLRYFVMGRGRAWQEESARFHVSSIVPTEADPSWMPAYPGLSDAVDCRDWEPGIPIQLDRVRPKDQEYWDRYRGTPKAFVSLVTGQRLWGNRFGDLTAIRYACPPHDAQQVERAVRGNLDPAALGLFFMPVRELGLRASRQSLDFGQLFIGFSFFLIVAALLLMAMLFVFNLEQRNEEVGILRALGYRPDQVRLLLGGEGAALAVVGSVLGLAAGAGYTRLTLHGLSTVWRGAVGPADFHYHAEPATLLVGFVASLAAALVAIWWALRSQYRRPVSQLLAGGSEVESGGAVGPGPRARAGAWVGGAGLVAALALVTVSAGGRSPAAAGLFFGAGACLLLAGLGFSQSLLVSLARKTQPATSLVSVGPRNAARRRGRSLTTIGVLATGVFLVVAVNAFRHDPRHDARQRHSGTGGFALYAQSTLPVYEDLNRPAAQRDLGLSSRIMKDVSVVSFRLREGDDASCLNLNRAIQPRLLGVQPAELARRRAFTFAGAVGEASSWGLLDRTEADGAVPAIGDEQTVVWALGKKLGETLTYTDDHGRLFTVRIVAVVARSILQGSLIISEENFVDRFPSATGYRAFLIDAPWEQMDDLSSTLQRRLQDKGLAVVPAWQRLMEFMAVENAYLDIFQALGGLGLILGSLGLGIVVLRNILERRGELALLQAVGFRRRALRAMVLREHWLLIGLGLVTGSLTALLAVWPALRSPGAELPVVGLATTVGALAVGGLVWTWLATCWALRGSLLPALRNE